MVIFVFRTRSVDVGSGVKVEFPAQDKTVHVLHGKDAKHPNPLERKTGYTYATTPSPRTVMQVDDIESVAERLPIRYEALESVLDELPEEFRETITQHWNRLN